MSKGHGRLAMKRQDGAALIVVLGVVALSTMIGLASMQSSQIDEKMAANYTLATRTALFAERAAMSLVPQVRAGTSAVVLSSNNDMDQGGFQSFAAKTEEEGSKSCLIRGSSDMTAAACYIEVPDGGGFQGQKAGNYIVAWSAISRGSKPFAGQPLIIQVEDGGVSGGAYRSVLLGCEGVSLSGSAKIDSYDSRKGAYDADLGKGKNSKGTQGIISTNADKDENGNVTLSGSSPIYGRVRATGSVTASGSASIYGDIQANGNVIISGGGSSIQGNVASRQAVRLTSSGTIKGNVEANTEIVTGSWGSSIEGNATAPVVRTTTNRDMEQQVAGSIDRSSPGVGEVATSSCDAFTTPDGATISDLTDTLAPYASSGSLSIGGGNRTYRLTPYGLQVPANNNNSVPNPERYQVTRDVVIDGIFPEPTNVLVLDSFSLGGSANFVVDGGDMTLYIKGDINIGGGATFSVAEGSSLKIVTDGRFNLPSGLDVASDRPTDDKGNPILSLYSTYDDGGDSGWNAGVNITGSSAFKGTIFAPYSTVNVAGSGGLYGAVKGRGVEVSGSAGIHYDEALMGSTVGTDGESAGGKGSNGGGISFTWL